MWCPACRADVAAELSLDSHHFRCARCCAELGQAAGSFGHAVPVSAMPVDVERSARDLLARWSAQNMSTPPQPFRSEVNSPATPTRSAGSMDAAAAREAQTIKLPPKHRVDRSELEAASLPTLENRREPIRSSNWSATIGQVCAYLGIGLITCGTAVVVWGYFGGPPQYAPTGWLVTTIGQMFLFLGVVTLISSGMEQTAAEVASRMDTFGARLVRIESLQHELAGPHLRRKTRKQNRETRGRQQEAA